MADQWVVKTVTNDAVVLDVTIGTSTFPLKIALKQLEPVAQLSEAIPKITAICSAIRSTEAAANTPPAKYAAAIGYTQAF